MINRKSITILFNLVLLVTLFSSCKKETVKENYIIEGKVKNYNGPIYLRNAVASKYYFDYIESDSVIVHNGKFEFKLSKELEFPLPFTIETDKISTNLFILEPQNQQIIIDSLYHRTSPKIIYKNSTINEEEQILREREKPLIEDFKVEFKRIRSDDFPKDSIEKYAINARKKLTYETNLVLANFTKEYPNSYVGFWKIVESQMYNGYNKELEKAFNNLSTTIKQTRVGKIFEESILDVSSLIVGRPFPLMKLKNKKLEEVVFKVDGNSNPNYILVDFWFSYCSPCIGQFPKMKQLHKKFYPNQLKIISISTDKTKNVDNWYKVMEDKNINWYNLLDENGVESLSIGINTFPTNYLLDNEGIILKKDVSLSELEVLLEKL